MQSPTVHALAQRARFVHGAARGPCTIEDRLSKAARSKKCMVGCRAHRCDNSDILPTDHRSRFEFIFMRPYTITWFALEVYVILKVIVFSYSRKRVSFHVCVHSDCSFTVGSAVALSYRLFARRPAPSARRERPLSRASHFKSHRAEHRGPDPQAGRRQSAQCAGPTRYGRTDNASEGPTALQIAVHAQAARQNPSSGWIPTHAHITITMDSTSTQILVGHTTRVLTAVSALSRPLQPSPPSLLAVSSPTMEPIGLNQHPRSQSYVVVPPLIVPIRGFGRRKPTAPLERLPN